MEEKLGLGDEVQDTLNGMVGKITARAEYLNDEPDRFRVEGIDSTGRPMDWWAPESRLTAKPTPEGVS